MWTSLLLTSSSETSVCYVYSNISGVVLCINVIISSISYTPSFFQMQYIFRISRSSLRVKVVTKYAHLWVVSLRLNGKRVIVINCTLIVKNTMLSVKPLIKLPVDEIAEVIQQFTVVLQHQIIPTEWTVLVTSKLNSVPIHRNTVQLLSKTLSQIRPRKLED